MWWPAIGGLVVGVGGLIFPQALGVGYDTIGDLLQGDVAGRMILGVLIVKSMIWSSRSARAPPAACWRRC